MNQEPGARRMSVSLLILALACVLSLRPGEAQAQAVGPRAAILVSRAALLVTGHQVAREMHLAWEAALMRQGFMPIQSAELNAAIKFSGKDAASLDDKDLSKLKTELNLAAIFRVMILADKGGSLAVKLSLVGSRSGSKFLSTNKTRLEGDVRRGLQTLVLALGRVAAPPEGQVRAQRTSAKLPRSTAQAAASGTGLSVRRAGLMVKTPVSKRATRELQSSTLGLSFGTTVVDELDVFVGVGVRGCTLLPRRKVISTATQVRTWCLATEVSLNYGSAEETQEIAFYQVRVLAGLGFLIGSENSAISFSLAGGAASSKGTIRNYGTDIESELAADAFIGKVSTHGRFGRLMLGVDVYFGGGGQVSLNAGVAL